MSFSKLDPQKRIKFISKEGNTLTNAVTDSLLAFYSDEYIEKLNDTPGVFLKKDR